MKLNKITELKNKYFIFWFIFPDKLSTVKAASMYIQFYKINFACLFF